MTKKELLIVFDSLREAIEWNQSLIDAYGQDSKKAKTFNKKIKQYNKLRTKIGDQLNLSTKSRLDTLIEEAKLINLEELKKEDY